MRTLSFAVVLTVAAKAFPAEHRVVSPDGRLALVVSDAGGLNYRVEVDGQPLLKPSRPGLEFAGGIALDPSAVVTRVKTDKHDGTWDELAHSNRNLRRRCVRNWRL